VNFYTYLDPYRPGSSLVHRLDPRIKAGLALSLILTIALIPINAWAIILLLFAASLSIIVLAELDVKFVWSRALLVLPFILAAIPMLFTMKGTPLANIPIGKLTLIISREGLVKVLNVMIKAWLSVQIAVVWVATTSFPHLLAALRALRVPRLLVAIVGLMWRYLFVLVDEAQRLLRARESRSGISTSTARPGGTLLWRAKVTGGLAGNLFLRALDRADRIYAAMLARGYDGDVRTLPLPPLAWGQWVFLGIFLTAMTLLTLLGLLLWG
jgi:cobalt/nickel transport system permease protein